MIDFGLAGLFDRFEKTFGSFLTKMLLIIIALAIVSICLRIIAEFVEPVFSWALMYKDPNARDIARAVGLMVNLLALVLLAAMLASYIDQKMTFRSKVDDIESVEKSLEEAKKIVDQELAILFGMENKDEVVRIIAALKEVLESGRLDDFLKEHEVNQKDS